MFGVSGFGDRCLGFGFWGLGFGQDLLNGWRLDQLLCLNWLGWLFIS